MKATITVRLHDEVQDPAGRALCERLNDMGYSEVLGARIGKIIEFEMETADREGVEARVKQDVLALID